MPGLKYLYLTCLCLIIYSFLPENSEHEVGDNFGRGNITDNFSIDELLSSGHKPAKDVSPDELRVRSGWTYTKSAGIAPAGSEDRS